MDKLLSGGILTLIIQRQSWDVSASAYTSFAFICRSCLASGYLGAQLPPETCLECGGGPLILHNELFDLSLAQIAMRFTVRLKSGIIQIYMTSR